VPHEVLEYEGVEKHVHNHLLFEELQPGLLDIRQILGFVGICRRVVVERVQGPEVPGQPLPLILDVRQEPFVNDRDDPTRHMCHLPEKLCLVIDSGL
jgi:hypothetical protein